MAILLVACGQAAPVPVNATTQDAKSDKGGQANAASVPLTGKGLKVQVAITDKAFNHPEVFIPPSATVVWTNNGQNSHTLIGDDEAFRSGSIHNGDTFEYTFDRPGTYIYHLDQSGGAAGEDVIGSVIVSAVSEQSKNMDTYSETSTGSDTQRVAQAPIQTAVVNAQSPAAYGTKRVFYIAAVEVEWDYAQQI